MTILKTVLAGLLAAAWSAAGAQADKPAAPPVEEKAAVKPKAAGEKPKEGPVIEIKRTLDESAALQKSAAAVKELTAIIGV